MNGMSALPSDAYTVLSADSIDGRIFSINIRTRDVSVLLQDDALRLGNSSTGVLPIGTNGLRTRGEYFYSLTLDWGPTPASALISTANRSMNWKCSLEVPLQRKSTMTFHSIGMGMRTSQCIDHQT